MGKINFIDLIFYYKFLTKHPVIEIFAKLLDRLTKWFNFLKNIDIFYTYEL